MAKILIGIGFLITLVSSLVIFYATNTAIAATRSENGSAAIATIAYNFNLAYLASFPNMLGLLILAAGIVVSLFTKKKIQ